LTESGAAAAPIATGLIGFGLGGRAFHAPLLAALPQFRLAAIATRQAEAVAAAHPGAKATDADALLADPAVALVVISTPNDTHYPLAQRALAAGKHVVIDKPFASDAGEARALAAQAQATGRVIVPYHNRRWDGDFRTVQALVAGGRLGTLKLVEAHWDRFSPHLGKAWKEAPGGASGQLPDLGSHMIDQALLLFGPPETVAADLARQRDGAQVEDYFDLTLGYPALRVRLASSRLIAAPRPRFALYGTAGAFVKHGVDPQEAALAAGGRADAPGHGEEPVVAHGTLTLADGSSERVPTQRGDYRRFYEGVAAAIRLGAPPPVDPADAVLGLEIIALARESARSGRTLRLG
jgi:scyllo-inositol 2-dehydrogenase (NADP+)